MAPQRIIMLLLLQDFMQERNVVVDKGLDFHSVHRAVVG